MSQDDELMNGERNRRQAAREELITAMLEGRSFQEISKETSVPLKRAMAYRLLHAVRTNGKSALQDGRHGHPIKLRGEARTFLEEYCRKTPQVKSSVVQTALQERFDLHVSISQINRVRATHGLSNHPANRSQKKNVQGGCPHSTRVARRCRISDLACCRSSNGMAFFFGDNDL
jgi:putative transposase